MIRRSTWIVLAGFLGLLGIYLWWSERALPASDGEPTPTPAPLWQVTSDQIRRISVEDLDSGLIVAAERDAEVGWKITDPIDAVQDAGRVERAATWLAAPVPRAELVGQTDLEPFGLAVPSYRVVVTLAGGSELILEVGRETPTGSSRYVKFSGRSGVLVFTQAALDEALGLLTDLVATATPTVTDTQTVTPGTPTAPASPTLDLTPTGTMTP
jgi:hypothetical protein